MQKAKTQNAQNTNVKTHSAKEQRNSDVITVEASNACKMQILYNKPGVKHSLKSAVHIKTMTLNIHRKIKCEKFFISFVKKQEKRMYIENR